jgi:hypothetical protein
MNKKILILYVALVLLIISAIAISAIAFTGNVVEDFNLGEIGYFDPSTIPFDYEYTTAVCEGNSCRDFVVTCLDGEAINIDPISEMVVFFDDWEDTREERNGLCE